MPTPPRDIFTTDRSIRSLPKNVATAGMAGVDFFRHNPIGAAPLAGPDPMLDKAVQSLAAQLSRLLIRRLSCTDEEAESIQTGLTR